MKTNFLIIVISLISLTLKSQTINDIPISDINLEYIQITGVSGFMTNKVKVDIDFGQVNTILTQKDTKIKDKSGNIIKFNSIIEALNFMSKNGYEYIDSYVITTAGEIETHYILKKNKE